MKKRTCALLILITLGACNQNDSSGYMLPTGMNAKEYATLQAKIRARDERDDKNPVDITLTRKHKNGLHTETVHYKAFPEEDTSIIIPSRFNLDTKMDYRTHPFYFTFDYARDSANLFHLVIRKDLFTSHLDTVLQRYGVLRELEGYRDSLGVSDSFHIYYKVKVPGTAYEQNLVLAGDSTGKYQIRVMH